MSIPTVAVSPTVPVTHPAGEYVQLTGKRLWVESEGSGPPVVLIGGFGPAGSHVVFHPHFSPLAATHQVIYVDLWGRGRSDQPETVQDITFVADVSDISELLAVLDLGRVHLYGFSYGGLVAQAVALEHPSLVASLTVANSLHSGQMWQLNHENINRELANQYPEQWEQIRSLRAEGLLSTDPRMRPLFGHAAPAVRFFNPDNAALIATEPGDRNLDLYPRFVGTDVDFIIGGEVASLPDFRTRLRDLDVPLMVLGGRFDRALYPKLQLEFATHAPGSEVHILERSGSYCHVEEAKTVLELLQKFIGGA